MQSNSMQDESESENNAFNIYRSNSERDQSINYAEIAKMQLRQYEDIDENQFQLIEEGENNSNNNNNNGNFKNNYLKLHTTFVPIGTNFQADIPELIPPVSYFRQTKNSMERLRRLKVHDPTQGANFYNIFHSKILEKFGGNFSYQQISLIRTKIQQIDPQMSIEAYLSNKNYEKFWVQYFKNKNQESLKKEIMKKKKKKNKGSMGS